MFCLEVIKQMNLGSANTDTANFGTFMSHECIEVSDCESYYKKCSFFIVKNKGENVLPGKWYGGIVPSVWILERIKARKTTILNPYMLSCIMRENDVDSDSMLE